MEKYREFVQYLSRNKVSKEFLNSDQKHALEVFVELFRGAQSKIRIFAANLCGDMEDGEEDTDYLVNKQEYISALSDFIERGGEVNIMLNRFDADKALRSNVMKRLFFYLTTTEFKDKIHIKSTSKKFHYTDDPAKNEVHFTVADDRAYRIETNIKERAATCNYNNSVMAGALITIFDNAFSEATPIDLATIFEPKV